MSSFVHLHCHTVWSLLDGALPAEALAHIAAERGYEAIAMTDHDSLTGAVRFAKACRDAGIKAIFGAELTLQGGEHVTAIAKDKTGYANLCRLITDSHLANERGEPATTFDKIAARAEGLFVLSGCKHGVVSRKAAKADIPGAIETARRWRDAIGAGYRIEVYDHRGFGDRALRDRLLHVAREAGVPAVATNDVHYGVPGHATRHEVLHAINAIVPLSRAQALRDTNELFLKDPAEMRALFADVPEVCDETLRIADQCTFELDLGSHHFPEIPMPPGETATGLLAKRCYEGARRRYGRITSAVEERLQHELQMIFRMGYAGYFLLVADIVDHTRRHLGIRCACRGSAAGSLVCYVLDISDVDPIRYDLLFERFMNERREELPDIDIDVESHRREEILEHILQTYGAEQTAMCCMVDTFRARGAIRDVGKALGIAADEIDTIAKAFPRISASAIPEAVRRLPELRGTNLLAGQLAQLFELCEAIDRFPRHLALHPSGVILSSRDLADRVPMQHSYLGFTMLQADKDDVEELGLAKLDVLGVRMQSSISHAVGEIQRTTGERVDLEALPHDDEETYALIRTSKTLGCFQIESPGQRDLLARFLPDRFEDLIIDISLFRPGPVKSDMINPYLNRRHGFEEFVYSHPKLGPILRETNGVIVFHEQVIRVIAAITGCSLDDADYVRRHLDAERPAMPDDPNDAPKKRTTPAADLGSDQRGGRGGTSKVGEGWSKEARVHHHGVAGPIEIAPPERDVAAWFIASAIANGFEPEHAERLWKEVFSFASFGFCKSHAAAFALPTYLSAWLKAHHPAPFYAGILTHDPGMYPRRTIVADARNFGIPILPIDVNRSADVYRAEDGGVRLALTEVRGISDAEVASILRARAERPFDSLEDLWRRVELSQPVLENLVEIGALDGVAQSRSRRELLWRAIDLAGGSKLKAGAQLALDFDEPIQGALGDLPDYTALEETEAELRISGIDARRHIVSLYRPLIAQLGCVAAADLADVRNRSDVWVAGIKVSTQTPAIRSGQRIIFLTLEDLTGPIDVTVFERVQPWCAWTVFHSWLILARGELRKRGGASFRHKTDARNVGVTISVEEVFDLAELSKDRSTGMSITDALDKQRRRQRAAAVVPEEQSQPPVKLWHASGGSAGR